ncbi:hypothetical protein D3C80_1851720 [compost metagenome]
MNNMTGGALPAMTFKRLMDYAHQGMELRPIPGIENPLPSGSRPEPSAGAANIASATENQPAFVRPRSLSAEATRIIRGMSKRFKDAPALSLSVQKVAGIENPTKSPGEQN